MDSIKEIVNAVEAFGVSSCTIVVHPEDEEFARHIFSDVKAFTNFSIVPTKFVEKDEIWLIPSDKPVKFVVEENDEQ